MDDLSSIVRAVSRIMMMWLSILFLGWAFLPDHRPVIIGLIFGSAFGMFYTRFLSIKVRGLFEFLLGQDNKRFNFGFLTRMCLVLIVVMIAMKLEHVSVMGVIIGLFISQLLTIPVGIVIGLRNKS